MHKQEEDRVSKRTRQNDKGADKKMESNDSPEIPDRGGGDIIRSRPPFGCTFDKGLSSH